MSETLIHEISLTWYKATSTAGTLDLGTWGSYGIEKLHLTLDAAWQNLTITAFFNVKGEVVAKTVVGKDGYADVPWEATKENTFAGRIVFEGSLDGQRRVSSDLNFKVTNHSSIEDVDSVPTEDRWNQFVTQNKEYRDGAYEAATKAEARAEDAAAASEDAQAAMRAAKASEDAAAASKVAAKGSEDKAKASADAAAESESNASASERAAAGSAAAAATSEGNAAESAKNAASAAKKAADESVAANIATLKQIQSDVTEKQNNAAASANAAADAEHGALAAKAAAETAVTNAGTAATRAATAAGTAIAAAKDAGNSADAAAQSKAAAETAAKAAQEAQAAAAAAKADAVKAQTAAQAAAKTAQDAKSAAEKARDDAQTARQGAEDARDAAAGSAEAAAKSEENAKQSADTLTESVENVAANTAAVAELKEKKAEIDDSAVGADGWSSKHIVDMLCPKIEESGNPVQCYPVAGYPLGVKASWGPVQEGSGEPYPAGGGKNLWGNLLDKVFVGTTGNLNTISTAKSTAKIACTEKDVYTLSNSNRFASPPSNVGIIAYFDNSDNMLARKSVVNNNVLTLIAPAGTAYVRASCYAPTDDDKIQFEKGATATSWGPYENIRPIKGRDSVTVERCGANLLKIDQFATKTRYGVTFEYVPDGGVRIQGTATAIVDSPTFSVWHLPPGKYFGLDMGEGIDASIVVERAGKRLWMNTKGTFEIMPGDITKYWYMIVNTGYVANATIYPCIVPGTTALTTYTPYTGQTNTLTLPESIYGGSVDAVNGEGAGTWKLLTLDGTEAWDAVGSGDALYFRSSLISIGTRVLSSGDYCTTFPIASISGSNTAQGINGWGKSLYLRWSTFADVDALKSYLAAQYAAGTPVQVCYKLATPVPFTATGGAALPALAGVNTVITDANSVAVTGRADPIKRIEDLEAAVASIN